ncbi:MAG: hypothetical protein JJ845_000815 [Prochlorococcus marinus CUG1436]|nr:hypothetical protein [Prochlorococcus marinus CUG1436]
MKLSQSILLAALSISSLIFPQKAQANLFRINITETGGNVVFSFDGSIDLTGASGPSAFMIRNRFRSAGVSFIEFGGNNDMVGVSVEKYDFGTGVSVPNFGTSTAQIDTGSSGLTVTGFGDPFKISQDELYLPIGSDGSNISGNMTFENTTFAALDITTGTYSYTLGNNNMEIVTTPTPGPLPILGMPVFFLYYKKLKDKSKI